MTVPDEHDEGPTLLLNLRPWPVRFYWSGARAEVPSLWLDWFGDDEREYFSFEIARPEHLPRLIRFLENPPDSEVWRVPGAWCRRPVGVLFEDGSTELVDATRDEPS